MHKITWSLGNNNIVVTYWCFHEPDKQDTIEEMTRKIAIKNSNKKRINIEQTSTPHNNRLDFMRMVAQ